MKKVKENPTHSYQLYNILSIEKIMLSQRQRITMKQRTKEKIPITKLVTRVFLFASTAKAIEKWFEIGDVTIGHVVSGTLTGPNQEYVLQGEALNYKVYSIDWDKGESKHEKDIRLDDTGRLDGNDRVQSDWTLNAVVTSMTIARFNAGDFNSDLNFQEYNIVRNQRYSYPMAARGTVYVFVSSMYTAPGNRKFYRLHSDRITEVVEFNVGYDSRAYGVLYGTNNILVSLRTTQFRKIYDYTNGYGGSNKELQTHESLRPGFDYEMGFMSPMDGRGYYVVYEHDNRYLITVAVNGGAEKLAHDFGPIFGTLAASITWIPDTDLCFLASFNTKVAIVDFMDEQKNRAIVTVVTHSGADIFQGAAWLDYKVAIAFLNNKDRSVLFKLEEESVCADLCKTCRGIYRKKCVACRAHSSKIPPDGDSCICDINYYESKISYTNKQCLECSQLCSKCTAGGPSDCLACRSSLMEINQGKCVCVQGFYFSDSTTCSKCDSSCKSCIGSGPDACSKCFVEEGKFLDASKRCLDCHPECKTCDGGESNKCLSCHKGFFLFSGSCVKCHESCETCSEGGRTGCNSCQKSEGFYLESQTKRCLECDPTCLTCSGPGMSACESCDELNGRFFDSGSCPECHTSCMTCSGLGPDKCKSCAVLGYFIESSTCISCAENDSDSCPPKTIISGPQQLEELDQNITITFKPSIELTDQTTTTSVSKEQLITKHLILTLNKKDGNQEPMTILKTKLTHQGKKESSLFISFLEKLRAKNINSINVSVKEPVIYRSSSTEQTKRIIYLKRNNKLVISITEKKLDQQEKSIEATTGAAQATTAAIGATATASVSTAAFTGGAGSSLVYLIKFFNILEIISNLAKINVNLGPRILLVINFIQNIKFTEIGLLSKFSPFKDSEPEEQDSNAYLLIPRGSRGKITTENSEIFIASGQNFLFSCLIVTSWIFMKFLELCLSPKNKVLEWVSFIYQMLIGMMFFDYQLICSAEVSMFDYSRAAKIPLKFKVSYFFSQFIIFLIAIEFIQAYKLVKFDLFNLIKQRMKEKKKELKEKDREKDKKDLEKNQVDFEAEIEGLEISPENKILLQKYTEVLVVENYGPQIYLTLFENLRFFAIQIIIASLQLLSRTQ